MPSRASAPRARAATEAPVEASTPLAGFVLLLATPPVPEVSAPEVRAAALVLCWAELVGWLVG